MTRNLLSLAAIFAALFLFCASTSAQTKRLDNNIQLSMGISGSNSSDTGLATKLSYGLDIYFNDSWSIMPSIGYMTYDEQIFYFGMDGGDFDMFETISFSLTPKFHKDRFNIGVGPYYSRIINNETYYIDWDPNDPLGGKSEVGKFDYGILPSISYDVRKHWRFGVEAMIGIPNIMIQYPEYDVSGTRRLKAIMATACFHF